MYSIITVKINVKLPNYTKMEKEKLKKCTKLLKLYKTLFLMYTNYCVLSKATFCPNTLVTNKYIYTCYSLGKMEHRIKGMFKAAKFFGFIIWTKKVPLSPLVSCDQYTGHNLQSLQEVFVLFAMCCCSKSIYPI